MKTTDEILSVLKSALESVGKVIASYDAEEQQDLNGVIALDISEIENLNHGGVNDYRISVNIKGQTLADEDKSKSKIMSMFNKCSAILQGTSTTAQITNCAGALFQGGNLESDGDTNNFSLHVDLFVCDAVFDEQSI